MSVKFKLYKRILEEGIPIDFMGRHFVGITTSDDELAKDFNCSSQSIYLAVRTLIGGRLMLKITVDSFRDSKRILVVRLDTAKKKLSENFKEVEVIEFYKIIKSYKNHASKSYNEFRKPDPKLITGYNFSDEPQPDKSPSDNDLRETYNKSYISEPYIYEVDINHKDTSTVHKDTSIHKETRTSTSNTSNTRSTSKLDGYYASEYAPGGSREKQTPKNDKTAFIRYFLRKVFTRRQVDYYLPKSSMGKYYRRAADVLKLVGGLEKGQKYIDWYLSRDELQKQGWNLDLMVSATMVNKFLGGDPSETKKGTNVQYAVTDEEREEMLKKARMF